MPRAEKNVSYNPENETRLSRLDLQLVEVGNELRLSYSFFSRDFEPQLEVITIMTILCLEDDRQLSKTDKAKLQKMIGLQMRHTQKTDEYAGDLRFWQLVEDKAGPEITKATDFAEDLSDLPKNWQPAYASLIVLHELFHEPES